MYCAVLYCTVRTTRTRWGEAGSQQQRWGGVGSGRVRCKAWLKAASPSASQLASQPPLPSVVGRHCAVPPLADLLPWRRRRRRRLELVCVVVSFHQPTVSSITFTPPHARKQTILTRAGTEHATRHQSLGHTARRAGPRQHARRTSDTGRDGPPHRYIQTSDAGRRRDVQHLRKRGSRRPKQCAASEVICTRRGLRDRIARGGRAEKVRPWHSHLLLGR